MSRERNYEYLCLFTSLAFAYDAVYGSYCIMTRASLPTNNDTSLLGPLGTVCFFGVMASLFLFLGYRKSSYPFLKKNVLYLGCAFLVHFLQDAMFIFGAASIVTALIFNGLIWGLTIFCFGNYIQYKRLLSTGGRRNN